MDSTNKKPKVHLEEAKQRLTRHWDLDMVSHEDLENVMNAKSQRELQETMQRVESKMAEANVPVTE
jgi:hypothetical protein